MKIIALVCFAILLLLSLCWLGGPHAAAQGVAPTYCATQPAHGAAVVVPCPSYYVAPDGRNVAQLIAAHVLPDPATTPGVLNPNVTQDTIKSTICVHGWTATVRPPVSYTDKLRLADTPAGFKPGDGELDHRLSIEDSGSPTDPKNLWWQVYNDHYGARVKDVLETKLSRAVCAGKMPLADAQAALLGNWLVAYAKYVGPLPK